MSAIVRLEPAPGGVMHLVMDDPSRTLNVLDDAAIASLEAALDSLEVDRVVVWMLDGDALVAGDASARDGVQRVPHVRVGRALAPLYFGALETSERIEADEVTIDARMRVPSFRMTLISSPFSIT